MKKILAYLATVLLVSNVLAQANITVMFPFVSPFGEVICKCPSATTSGSLPMSKDGSWSAFGLVISSIEKERLTVTYVALSKSIELPSDATLSLRVGDFRAVRDTLSEWFNGNLTLSKQFSWGTLTLMNDWYAPSKRAGYMNLIGVGYSSPTLAITPDVRVTGATRIAHINYGGFQWDSRIAFTFRKVSPFVRIVQGYDSNVSGGISVTF